MSAFERLLLPHLPNLKSVNVWSVLKSADVDPWKLLK